MSHMMVSNCRRAIQTHSTRKCEVKTYNIDSRVLKHAFSGHFQPLPEREKWHFCNQLYPDLISTPWQASMNRDVFGHLWREINGKYFLFGQKYCTFFILVPSYVRSGPYYGQNRGSSHPKMRIKWAREAPRRVRTVVFVLYIDARYL